MHWKKLLKIILDLHILFTKERSGGKILPRRKRRRQSRSNDDWLNDLIGLGLGVLAVAFLTKLTENTQQITTCPYCHRSIGKWARTCPNCRNDLGL